MDYLIVTHFICFLAGIFVSFLFSKPGEAETIRKFEIENRSLRRKLFLLEKFIRRSSRKKKHKSV
jgi:hypothetical protein|tara:strand:+ start:161 stop:355 length:195 start_codon:yes stop_codon:yes gene_type:complete